MPFFGGKIMWNRSLVVAVAVAAMGMGTGAPAALRDGPGAAVARVPLDVFCVGPMAARAPSGKGLLRYFYSPKGGLVCIVTPVFSSGPPVESVVEIRDGKGHRLLRHSFTSNDGQHGFHVMGGAWSPDGRYFVFTTTSSGGHSPWQNYTFCFSKSDTHLWNMYDLVGLPVVDPSVHFSGPGTVVLTLGHLTKAGEFDSGHRTSVNLPRAIAKARAHPPRSGNG